MAVARRIWLAAAVGLTALGGVACSGSEPSSARRFELGSVAADQAVTYDYTIPLGTGRRADLGERPVIFPDQLDARLGESIRIVNADDRTHTIGPFTVGPGQTLSQKFVSVGMFIGFCTTHQDGRFTLRVTA